MLIFTALSVTREIERGTMESLLAMPITPVEIMFGKIIPYVLGIYLIMKLADLAVAGQLDMIANSYPQNVYWLIEVIVGVVLPIVLLSIPKVRENRASLFGSALLVIGGLIFNRFNVSLLWQTIRPGYTYFPHWMEFAVSAGVVAWAIIVFMLAIRLLPIEQHHDEAETPGQHVSEVAVS